MIGPLMGLALLQYGFGPIGQAIVRAAEGRHGMEVVGVVDPAPDKRGSDVGELLGYGPRGLRVVATLRDALEQSQPSVVAHATGSHLPAIAPQLRELVDAGLPIVSTAEELSFPWARHPELAKEIDAAARRAGVAVLGTGVNPGFVMDLLPLALSAAVQRVDHVFVERVVDAATRRLPLQQKVGVGLEPAAARAEAAAGRIGHVGLRESMGLMARGLGLPLDSTEETLEPVVADRLMEAGGRQILAGRVLGLRQEARGRHSSETVIELRLEMRIGAPNPRDEIRLTGLPSLHVSIAGGTPGDVATPAVVLNYMPKILAAPAGLRTMLDLPFPTAWRQHPLK